MAEPSGPSPDRNNPRPLLVRGPEQERVHRVPDNERPKGGPFGPGKKKKPKGPPRGGKGFGGSGGGGTGGGGRGSGGGERGFGRDDPRDARSARPQARSDRPPGRDDRAVWRQDRSGGRDDPPGSSFNRPGKPSDRPGKPFQRGPDRFAPVSARPKATRAPRTQSTDWAAAAEWYDQLVGDDGSEYHREVVIPGTLKLLGDVAGKRVLDVACGQGVLARQLYASGATVIAVDAAEPLIAAARQRNSDLTASDVPPPDYRVGDATSLANVPESDFDLAACVLAIQDLHPHGPVFEQVAKRLRASGAGEGIGRFVVVMMHPAFRSPKVTRWGWDAAEGVQFRRVDRYLTPRKEPIVTHPGQKTGQYTWSFHRPIGDYVAAARKAGLCVDAMEEWPSHKTSTSGPRAAAENTARSEIPMFLALRCIRV